MAEKKLLQQTWLVGLAKLVKRDLLPSYNLDTVACYGFPKGRSSVDNVRGTCYKALPGATGTASRDVIFIHPAEWANPSDVVRTFIHEAIHSVLPPEAEHGTQFQALAEAVGLLGELRDTPNADLQEWIDATLASLPPMPSDPLARDPRFEERPPEKGRMRLYVCSCGVKIRCGRKDLQATCDLCAGRFELRDGDNSAAIASGDLPLFVGVK